MAAKTLRDILNEKIPLDDFKSIIAPRDGPQNINSIIKQTGSRTIDTGKSQQMYIQMKKTQKVKQFYTDNPASSNDLKLLFDQGFDHHNLKECIDAFLNHEVTYYDLKFILENATQLDPEDLKDVVQNICTRMQNPLNLEESPTVMDLALKLKDPELISILKTHKFKSTAEWVIHYVEQKQWLFLKTKTESYNIEDWLQIVDTINNIRMTPFYILVTQNNMSNILKYMVFPLCKLKDAEKCILPDNTPLEVNQANEITQLLNNICMEYYITDKKKWLEISDILFRIYKSLKRTYHTSTTATPYTGLVEQNISILDAVIKTAMKIHMKICEFSDSNNHDELY